MSDSLPIQWWLEEEETFNESNPICGLTNACFCLPFNCDDSIVDQFTDEPGQNIYLIIYDVDDVELTRIQYEEVSSGAYQITFIPSEISPAICEKIKFKRLLVTYAFTIESSITDLLEDVEGNMTFVPEALLFDIEGDVTDLLEEVDGEIQILTLISISNTSLDISISGVTVDGTSATLVSGSLPVNTGNSATLATKKTGLLDIVVVYSSSAPDQHITLSDSDSNVFCQSNAAPPNTYSGCVVNQGGISIEAGDGTCP